MSDNLNGNSKATVNDATVDGADVFEARFAALLDDNDVLRQALFWEFEGEMYLHEQTALSVLFGLDHLFWNPSFGVVVFCSDTFAYACADGEKLENESDLLELTQLWFEDRKWGVTRWCAQKRKQQPLPYIREAMVRDGAWRDEYDTYAQSWKR